MKKKIDIRQLSLDNLTDEIVKLGAFALAVAALMEGRADATWARWCRTWTNMAWAMLTCGIALGSWWAYYELGWGRIDPSLVDDVRLCFVGSCRIGSKLGHFHGTLAKKIRR